MNSTGQKDLGLGPWPRRVSNKGKTGRNQNRKGLVVYRSELHPMGNHGSWGIWGIWGIWDRARRHSARILRSWPLLPVPKRVMQKDCLRLNHSVDYQLKLWPQTPGSSLDEMAQISESWENAFALAQCSPQVHTKSRWVASLGFFVCFETYSWILTLLVLSLKWQIKLIPLWNTYTTHNLL